ncbi:MAG TPA: molecular chaperone DnaJ [Patescibacteria group bacterium]|nr:molecular chaperone DnaJ [Patescibacteria group bacterium]
MAKDYYEILGIPKTANEQEIKRAYRKLAHEHHPDKAGGDPEKFKELNHAYEVLSDPKKRQQYDQFGSSFEGAPGAPGGAGGFQWGDFAQGASGGRNPFEGFGAGGFENISDIFDQFFGGGGGARTAGRGRENRGRDLEKDLELTFTEAVFGVEKVISFERQSVCEQCKGSGTDKGSKLVDCKTCKGTGEVTTQQRTMFGVFQTSAVCEKCHGRGKVPDKECSTCRGKGVEWKRVELRVTIPAGMEDGGVLKLSGEGEAGAFGGTKGDLYIHIRAGLHEQFKREGDRILLTVPISYSTAVLGGMIRVPTLWGDVDLKIPPGTQSYQKFILKSKGVPHLRGRGKGDQVVTIVVSIPTKVGSRERQLLEELRSSESRA